MNPEIKKLWVDALRSGKYRQGTGVLETPDGEFCCLGVLCDLAVKQGITTRSVHEPDEYNSDTRIFYDENYELPDTAVMKWAGLNDSDPLMEDEHGSVRAASTWNDIQLANFNEIANLIERNL